MRKSTYLLTLLMVFGLLVAACGAPTGGTGAADTSGSDAAAEESATTDAESNTITVALESEPPNLDPHASEAWFAFQVTMQLFDNLVVIDPETLEFAPALAESWEASEDGLTWTFKLREDVTFHDGTPLNAEAVAFSFNRIIDPEVNSPAAAPLLGGNLESAEVVDEFTVQFNLTNPFAGFLDALAAGYGGVVPVSPAAVEEYGEDFGQNPVGTGPFMFREWIPADRVVLVPNPDYNWGPEGLYETAGPPQIDELIFRIVPEATTRTAMLETGEADVAITANTADIARLEESDEFVVIEGQRPGTASMIQFNTERAPTDDINVRRAVLHTLNMGEMIELVYQNQRPVATGPIEPSTFGYNPAADDYYAQDLEAASALLAESGWADSDGDGILDKDGEPLSLVWICFPGQHCQQGEIFQAQLREIGVDVEIREMSQPANVQATQRGEHHIRTIGWGGSDASQLLHFLYHSENIGSGWNFNRWGAPELDEMLDAAVAEIDPDARKEMVEEIQVYVMGNALSAPVNYYNRIHAARAEVEGLFTEYLSALLMFKDAHK